MRVREMAILLGFVLGFPIWLLMAAMHEYLHVLNIEHVQCWAAPKEGEKNG